MNKFNFLKEFKKTMNHMSTCEDDIKFKESLYGYELSNGKKKMKVLFTPKKEDRSLHMSKSKDGSKTLWVGKYDCLNYIAIQNSIHDFFGKGKNRF